MAQNQDLVKFLMDGETSATAPTAGVVAPSPIKAAPIANAQPNIPKAGELTSWLLAEEKPDLLSPDEHAAKDVVERAGLPVTPDTVKQAVPQLAAQVGVERPTLSVSPPPIGAKAPIPAGLRPQAPKVGPQAPEDMAYPMPEGMTPPTETLPQPKKGAAVTGGELSPGSLLDPISDMTVSAISKLSGVPRLEVESQYLTPNPLDVQLPPPVRLALGDVARGLAQPETGAVMAAWPVLGSWGSGAVLTKFFVDSVNQGVDFEGLANDADARAKGALASGNAAGAKVLSEDALYYRAMKWLSATQAGMAVGGGIETGRAARQPNVAQTAGDMQAGLREMQIPPSTRVPPERTLGPAPVEIRDVTGEVAPRGPVAPAMRGPTDVVPYGRTPVTARFIEGQGELPPGNLASWLLEGETLETAPKALPAPTEAVGIPPGQVNVPTTGGGVIRPVPVPTPTGEQTVTPVTTKQAAAPIEAAATARALEKQGEVNREELGNRLAIQHDIQPSKARAIVNQTLEESQPKSITQEEVKGKPTEYKPQAIAPSPSSELTNLANEYNASQGLPPVKHEAFEVDESLSKRVADFYDKAESTPNAPEVQNAYKTFNDETHKQFEFLTSKGYTFEPVEGQTPYQDAKEMHQDILDNKHLYVSTASPPEHGLITPEQNYEFRAVHDTMGHALPGATFGHGQEEAAYRSHLQMYSPEAQKAMATETRAQNAATHFSEAQGNPPEKAYVDKADVGLKFAPQKATVLPEDLRSPTGEQTPANPPENTRKPGLAERRANETRDQAQSRIAAEAQERAVMGPVAETRTTPRGTTVYINYLGRGLLVKAGMPQSMQHATIDRDNIGGLISNLRKDAKAAKSPEATKIYNELLSALNKAQIDSKPGEPIKFIQKADETKAGLRHENNHVKLLAEHGFDPMKFLDTMQGNEQTGWDEVAEKAFNGLRKHGYQIDVLPWELPAVLAEGELKVVDLAPDEAAYLYDKVLNAIADDVGLEKSLEIFQQSHPMFKVVLDKNKEKLNEFRTKAKQLVKSSTAAMGTRTSEGSPGEARSLARGVSGVPEGQVQGGPKARSIGEPSTLERRPTGGFLSFRRDYLAKHPGADPKTIRPIWEISKGASIKDATRGFPDNVRSEVEKATSTSRSTEPLVSKMEAEGGKKAKAGMDPRIMKVLGGNLYSGDLAKITLKESIQNAIDSAREGGGDVRVVIDSDKNLIQVSDNGTGMLPSVATKEFVDIGGSKKGENASGGFGIAKVAIFANAAEIDVVTTAKDPKTGDIITTRLTGSGEDWLDPNKGFDVEQHIVPYNTPTGTKLSVKLNPDKRVSGYSLKEFLKPLMDFPQHGLNLTATIDGEEFTPVPNPANKVTTLRPEGARLDVYASDKTAPIQWGEVKVRVLNKGLYQFTHNVYAGDMSGNVPTNISIDIHATSGPEEENYPFRPDREGLRGELPTLISNYIKENFLADAAEGERIKLQNAIKTAPAVKGTRDFKVFDTGGQLPATTVNKIANATSTKTVLQQANLAFKNIQKKLAELTGDPIYSSAELSGIGLGSTYLGLNISGASVHLPKNLILLNPFNALAEVESMVGRGLITAAEAPNQLAQSIIATIVHELSHQASRSHNEEFSGALTRNIQRTPKEIYSYGLSLSRALADKGTYDALKQQHEELETLWTRENIFGKVSTESTAAGRQPPGNKGDTRRGEEVGPRSEEAVRSSDVNTTKTLAERRAVRESGKPVDKLLAKPYAKLVEPDELRKSGFIGPDGEIIQISGDHYEALEQAGLGQGPNDARAIERALAETKLARMFVDKNGFQPNITIELHASPTRKMLSSIRDVLDTNPKAGLVYDLYKDGKRAVSENGFRDVDSLVRDVNRVYRSSEAGFITLGGKKQKPLPNDAEYDQVLKDREKSGPSLLDRLRDIPQNIRRNYVDMFADLKDTVKSAVDRGLIFAPGEDPYKVARIVFGGWGGPIEEAMTRYGDIKKEAYDAGLSDHLTKFLDTQAYIREWQVVSDKVANLRQKLQSTTLTPTERAALNAEKRVLENNLRTNKVVPQGKTVYRLQADLVDLRSSVTPAEWTKIRGFSDRVYNLTSEALDGLRQDRIISAESYNALRAHPNYVSLRRILADHDDPIASTFSVRKQNVIHAMRGSTLSNVDPFEATALYHAATLRLRGRNLAAKTAVNFKNIDPSFPARELHTGQKPAAGEGTISYLEDGVTHTYAVPSTWSDAMKISTASEVNIIGQSVLALSRSLLQKGATGWNLAFILRNVQRDYKDARAFLPTNVPYNVKNAALYGALYADTLKKLITDPTFKAAYLTSGAAYSTFQRQFTPEEWLTPHKVFNPKTAVETVFADVAKINSLAEEAQKTTAWRWLLSQGYDPVDAAYFAREYGGSPDFARKGLKSAQAGLISMFFNPAIQGAARDIKFVTAQLENPENTKGPNLRKLLWYLGGAALTSFALAKYNSQYLNPDDNMPEKSHETPSERQNYNTVYLPQTHQTSSGQVKHEAVKFPKSHLEQLVRGPIDAAINQLIGVEDTDELQTFLNMASSVLPGQFNLQKDDLARSTALGALGSLNPILQEPLEQISNTDFGLDAPIVPEGEKNIKAHMQYGPRTSRGAIDLAAAVKNVTGAEVSPRRIDHIVNSGFAGVGEQASTLLDFFLTLGTSKGEAVYEGTERLSKIPLVGPMIRSFVGSASDGKVLKLEEDFYKNVQSATTETESFNKTLKGITEKPEEFRSNLRELANDPRRIALLSMHADLTNVSKVVASIHQLSSAVARSTTLTKDKKQELLGNLWKGYRATLQIVQSTLDAQTSTMAKDKMARYMAISDAAGNVEDKLGLSALFDASTPIDENDIEE